MVLSWHKIRIWLGMMMCIVMVNALLPFFMVYQAAGMQTEIAMTTTQGNSFICHQIGIDIIKADSSDMQKLKDFYQETDSQATCPFCVMMLQALHMIVPDIAPRIMIPFLFNPPLSFSFIIKTYPKIFQITDYIHPHAPPILA